MGEPAPESPRAFFAQDEPNAGSPPQGGLTPRRPASPMRRSGIGMGVPAAAATTAASPARGGGILDGPMGRSGIPLSGQGGMEGPALAGGFAPSGPVQHSPQPAYVPPVAVAAATTADPAAGYDVRRLSSPLTARFSMNGTSTSTAGGFLGSLDVSVRGVWGGFCTVHWQTVPANCWYCGQGQRYGENAYCPRSDVSSLH